ncbi:ribulose-phosphate 3-epimerase [Aerococcus urinae]|nr:ribulose-phosphate 3-epimerase [Aerococcus urinae]MCY3045630.1 ribulose-phosphate 3-epimerase [Aerococcus urinae]MCY3058370.1 ribulose-phosphate 3-epimerase [Aerococcus urinae]
MKKNKQLVCSIMTADQLHLAKELDELKEAGINWLHCDVMDGQFVDNLAMGPYEVEYFGKMPDFTVDIHMAVKNPEKYVKMFAPCRPDYITFHVEAAEDPNAVIQLIQDEGIGAGIAISPDTPLLTILPYLNQVDLVLMMTVKPGFAGQAFREDVLEKLDQLTQYFEENFTNENRPLVEVDGNINPVTMAKMQDYAVDLYVLGTSALFNEDPRSYKEKADEMYAIIGK